MITYSGLGLMGRFGNQLFQISSTIGIARRNGHDFCFPKWEHQSHFSNKLPEGYAFGTEIKEKNFHYDEYILPKEGSFSLSGYFQSWRYFEYCKEEILRYFSFPKRIIDNVAVHIRRGDYVGREHFHGLIPPSYYNLAMDQFPGRNFIVFSDDIKWCENNIKHKDVYFYQNSGDDIEDFKYLASHKSLILANSSYSWWASYLSQSEEVIAPKKWFTANIDTKDLCPPDWTLL